MEAAAAPRPDPGPRILAAGAVGALVAVALGIYGSVHDPASDLSITLGFRDTITMKVWLASVAALFGVFQVFSALWIYGKLPFGAKPAWMNGAHRISGRLAFLFSLPVAYHCLYQLAFQDSTTRVLAHSLLGCVFYGAFATKVMLIRTPGKPGYVTPARGRRAVRGADRRVAHERPVVHLRERLPLPLTCSGPSTDSWPRSRGSRRRSRCSRCSSARR